MKMVFPPVKDVAIANNIPVFQPENFREDETVEQLRSLAPDVIAVVAYGRILPQRVLDIAPLGCINIHASILPEYRGSAPYQWAVLDGKAQTGVTAMYLCREMDAGDIIDIAKTPIAPEETAGELLDRLAVLGADLLSKTLTAIREGTVQRTPQDNTKATYAPMLDKSMCPIDWNKTAQQVHNHVRGMNPWPSATAEIQGQWFKIHQTAVVKGVSGTPGKILGLTKTGLLVACADDAVEIRILQAQGGKRMSAPDYFRGHPLEL
jgi:methionyl-tRNA formyltransferase